MANSLHRRGLLLTLLAGCAGVGCRNPGVARVLMEGPEGSGIMGSKVFAILAVYQAGEAQRVEAERRARQMEQRWVATHRAAPAPAAGQPAVPPPPAEPTPEERKSLPPVLAVKVEDPRRQGAATVMLWDTRTASLADTNVYDLKKEPPTGRPLTWKTSVAALTAVYTGDDWPN